MQAILACEHQDQCDPYRQILINCGLTCGADDAVTYGDLVTRVNRGGAQLLTVLLGNNPREVLKLVEQIHVRNPMPILVLGPSHDAQLIIESMKAGARDYLDLNHPREGLAKSLEKLRQSGAIHFQRGQCIAVTGAIPGSGVTTVASGLAFALAAAHPKQVVLAELGSGVPELDLDLDLKSRHSVSNLLKDWNRIDTSAVRHASVEHADGVFILPDGASNGMPPGEEAQACKQLISLVRTIYNYGVYDVGHAAQTALSQQAIRLADQVVLVVRLDVPGLRMTRNMMTWLSELGVSPKQLTLVGNRHGQRKQIGWSKAEEALGMPVNVWLPDDPGAVNQALNLGLPLTQTSKWTKFGRRLNQLAQLVAGAEKK